MKSTRFWVILIGIILTASAAAAFFIYKSQPSGTVANIYQGGACVHSIDLSVVEEAYSFTIESELGENIVTVEKGRICVSEANCPDRVCVHQGWISNGVVPVACLPHKLVIQIEEAAPITDIDGVSR